MISPSTRFLLLVTALLLTSCASSRVNQYAQQRNRDGLNLLGYGEYAQAATEFAAAAKLDPSSPIIKNNLGVAYLRLHRVDEATRDFEEAVRLDDSKALYHKNLGNAYLALGKLDLALLQFQRALDINPAEPGVHGGIIAIAFDMGTTDEWIKKFEEEMKSAKPDDARGVDLVYLPEQAILSGLILQGKYDEAVARSTSDIKAVGGVQTEHGGYVVPIITPFFFWIHTVPKTRINMNNITASLYNFRGRAYLGKGMFEDAISDFRISAEKAPKGFGDMWLGFADLQKGDAREAAYELRKVLDPHPDSIEAHLLYSVALRGIGDAVSANEQLKGVRDVTIQIENTASKHNYWTIEALAYANQASGQLDVALKEYERVLTACPSCGWSFRNAGEICEILGDKTKARDYLTKAAALLPSDQRIKELLQGL